MRSHCWFVTPSCRWHEAVHRREIEVHLAGVLGLELADLQLNHDIASQRKLVQQQVDEEVLATDLQMLLASHHGEALSQLQQEPLHVRHQSALDIPLVGLVVESEKSENVGISARLLGLLGLGWLERAVEVRQPLARS